MFVNSNLGYKIDGNGIEMFGMFKNIRSSSGSNKVFIPKGQAIHIEDIIESIEDGSLTLKLSYLKNRQQTTLLLPLQNPNKSELIGLAKYGADVTENNVNILIDVLQNEKFNLGNNPSYQVKYLHKHLGWSSFNNQKVFKGQCIISSSNLQSTYNGNYYIKPQGNFKDWKTLIKTEVLGHTELEFAVIIGLSSIVNAYIGKDVGCDNLLIHLIGESTTGKTTAGMLALSTAGLPLSNYNSKETCMRTWNSTKNASLNSLNGNHGFPVLFDEFSMNNDYNITDLIYSLIYGKDKSRLNGDSEQKTTEDFHTTIISTGEASILNKTSKNTGLLVRLIEFANIQWTTSAKQSETIKSGCIKNCGWAIYKVAKYLLETPIDEIKVEFNTQKQLYLNSTTIKNEFSERIATKYAMLLLTTKIAIKSLNLNFDHNKILRLLLENEQNSLTNTPSNVGKRAYNSLLEYVFTNQNYFITKDRQSTYNQIYGKIEKDVIIIPKEKFDNIMISLNYEDTKTILKNWRESNLLDCDKDRYTRKRRLDSTSSVIPCYIIRRHIDEKNISISKLNIPLLNRGDE